MKKYLFIALVAFLAVTSANAQLRIKMGKNSPIEKLGRAEIAITNLYVDSVDESKLVEDAIRGMLEKLDPHSSYTTAKETKAMNEPLKAGKLKIIKTRLKEDGSLSTSNTAVGVSVKLDWKPGGSHDVEI